MSLLKKQNKTNKQKNCPSFIFFNANMRRNFWEFGTQERKAYINKACNMKAVNYRHAAVQLKEREQSPTTVSCGDTQKHIKCVQGNEFSSVLFF